MLLYVNNIKLKYFCQILYKSFPHPKIKSLTPLINLPVAIIINPVPANFRSVWIDI